VVNVATKMAMYTTEEALEMICQEYDSGGEIDIEEDWRFPLQHTEDDSDVDMGVPMQSPSMLPPLSPPSVSPSLRARSRSQTPDPRADTGTRGREHRERGGNGSQVRSVSQGRGFGGSRERRDGRSETSGISWHTN